MAERGPRTLKEGESCWRIRRAQRAKVLVDGAAYYETLRACLLKARRSVFIVGWDIDSRTPLVGPSGEAEDGLPVRLGPFLTELVARRPAMRVHILLWDYSMLYALEREPVPSINLVWRTPDQISVCLDDVLPIGASHHQKIVVIDDTIAFSGGLDLTIRRWDTPAHELENCKRTDPGQEQYRPFHDVQMMVDGEAALALADLVRTRWRRAACERPVAIQPRAAFWPEGLEPDFTDVDVGIARTMPAYDGNGEIREVETLYCRSIDAAEKSIYIEAQYLTADCVASRLARRLEEKPGLEVLIVAPNVHHSWLEEHSMNAGRRRFMKYLQQACDQDRVRLVYPALHEDPTGEGVMVHAKFMIVDDAFLRVGSANLNNRSMGMDTECDLALEATTPAHHDAIRSTRNRLLAEHLNVRPEAIDAAVAEHGSLVAAVDALSGCGRTLRPIELEDVADDELSRTVGQIADPERPIETPSFAGDLFGGTAEARSSTRILKLLAVVLAVLGLAAIWRFTPLSEFTDPGETVRQLERFADDVWMLPAIPLVFVLAGLVAFPVTILIAVMGMMFSPSTAFAYGLAGSLLSAGVTYYIGHLVGRGPFRELIGPRVNRISRSVARRGILSVTALRLMPVAPFSLINLIAGASHIRVLDFFVGTILGMAPGILALSLLGYQLAEALRHPTMPELILLGLGLAGWLVLCVAMQYLAGRLRSRRHG